MPRIRASIAELMALVLVLGVGIGALLNASPAWAVAIPALTTVVLLAAILGAIYRDGAARAAWIGFLVFGWGFVLLSVPEGTLFKDTLTHPVERSRQLLRWMNLVKTYPPPAVGREVIVQFGTMEPATATVTAIHGNGSYRVRLSNGAEIGAFPGQFQTSNSESYFTVGESLAVLVAGSAGALIALAFFATRPSRPRADGPG